MLGLLGLLGAHTSRADPPQVEARQVASYGPLNITVTEPAIAAGPHTAVTVFFDRPRLRAWYAARKKGTKLWAQGVIDPNTAYDNIHDLSIAYDTQTNGFLAVAKTEVLILTCRFEPGPDLGEVTPGTWQPAGPWQYTTVDKPWIVAGDPNLPGGQEYYVTYSLGNHHYWYLRSVDGGQTWYRAPITLGGDPNQPVQGNGVAQPAVDGDGPLYVAYVTGSENPHIALLVGVDAPTSPPPSVDFSKLKRQADDPNDPPVPVGIPLNHTHFNALLPGPFETKVVSQLAVDPSDADRLYIVYHNTETNDPNDTDVNVYLHKLAKVGDYWQLGPQRQVNDPSATTYESDQFLPSVTVDDTGRVHIIYYDDQRFTDGPTGDLQPDQGSPEPDFDVYYAWSEDQGANWLYARLHLDPDPQNDPPALEFSLEPSIRPKEYIGIAWYGAENVSEVWTAYTGTWEDDPQPNDAVMWSSLIDWTP